MDFKEQLEDKRCFGKSWKQTKAVVLFAKIEASPKKRCLFSWGKVGV